MKRIFFLLLILPACRSDTPTPAEPCALEQWGSVRIQNFNADRYEIKLPGVIIVTVDGNSSTTIDQVPAKVYRVEFQNLSTGSSGLIDDFAVEACATNLLPIIF